MGVWGNPCTLAQRVRGIGSDCHRTNLYFQHLDSPRGSNLQEESHLGLFADLCAQGVPSLDLQSLRATEPVFSSMSLCWGRCVSLPAWIYLCAPAAHGPWAGGKELGLWVSRS
jgi:hypothetical protein